GGLVALGFGLALLFQNQSAPYQANTWFVVGVGTVLAAVWAFVIGKGLAARRNRVATGVQTMVGMTAVARGSNLVSVKGELWNAHTSGGERLQPGEEAVVEAGESGLTLLVRPVRVEVHAEYRIGPGELMA